MYSISGYLMLKDVVLEIVNIYIFKLVNINKINAYNKQKGEIKHFFGLTIDECTVWGYNTNCKNRKMFLWRCKNDFKL